MQFSTLFRRILRHFTSQIFIKSLEKKNFLKCSTKADDVFWVYSEIMVPSNLIVLQVFMLGNRTLFLQLHPRSLSSLLISLTIYLHDDLAFFLSFSYTHWFIISTCPRFSPGQQPTALLTPAPTLMAWVAQGFLQGHAFRGSRCHSVAPNLGQVVCSSPATSS